MLFQPFKKATRPETPGFAKAEADEGLFKARAKQQENALRSQNIMGGAQIYNEAMGDKSPIADSLFGVDPLDVGTTAELAGGSEALGLADVGAAQMGAGAIPMAGAVPVAAPTAMGAGTGAAVGGTAMAAPVAAGAASSAVPAAAAMGPAGWAALAGMALMNGWV